MRFDYCQTCFVLLYEVLSKNRENYDIYPKELKIHIRVYFFKQIIFHIFQSPPYTIKLNKVEHRHKKKYTIETQKYFYRSLYSLLKTK